MHSPDSLGERDPSITYASSAFAFARPLTFGDASIYAAMSSLVVSFPSRMPASLLVTPPGARLSSR